MVKQKKKNNQKNKNAVSPVISTVLLIMIVVVLAMIIFLWAKGFIKEAVLKEIAGTEKTAEQYCLEVKLQSIVNGEEFGFKNIGNVPVYKFDLKLVEKDSGSSEIAEYSGQENMAGPNKIIMIKDQLPYSSYETIKVIPILLGKGQKDGGIKEFRCAESQAILI